MIKLIKTSKILTKNISDVCNSFSVTIKALIGL